MKKIFAVMASALLVASAWAQTPEKYPSVKGFVTNGFWDNWEISVGGGINVARGADKKLGWEVNGSLTKWVHPIFGVRGMAEGGYFKNVKTDKWGYAYFHFDGMLNFSNWAGGYRADRAYYAVPFAGMGLMHSSQANTFAFDAGLLNKFRVCDALDINLELKALLSPRNIAPANTIGGKFYAFSATAGITYRFNRRDWDRKPVGTLYTADQIRAYQKAVDDANAAAAAANAEKARLAKELKDAQDAAARAAAELAAAKNAQVPATTLDPATIILYKIGTSSLTAEEKVRLDLKADQIKNGPKNQVYTIEGHADPQTGTAAINQRLSEQRAKVVFDYLVSQGVNPSQLRYEGMGDSHNQYKTPVANRVAIIK